MKAGPRLPHGVVGLQRVCTRCGLGRAHENIDPAQTVQNRSLTGPLTIRRPTPGERALQPNHAVRESCPAFIACVPRILATYPE